MYFALLPIFMDFGYDESFEGGQAMYVRGFLTKQERDDYLRSVAPEYAHLHFDLQPRAASYEEAQHYAPKSNCLWTREDTRGRDFLEEPLFDVIPNDFSIDTPEDCLMSMQRYPWLAHVVPKEYQCRDMQLALCPKISERLATLFYIEQPIVELQQAFLACLGDGTGRLGEPCLSILLTEHGKFYTHLMDAVKPGLAVALQLTEDDDFDARRAAIVDFLQMSLADSAVLPSDLALEFSC